MASDLAVSAVQALAAPRTSALTVASATTAAASPQTELTSKSPPPVNPNLHVDVALNIVVLQFYNAQGDITQSIPSPKQLQAYQANESSPAAASKLL